MSLKKAKGTFIDPFRVKPNRFLKTMLVCQGRCQCRWGGGAFTSLACPTPRGERQWSQNKRNIYNLRLRPESSAQALHQSLPHCYAFGKATPLPN